VVYKFFSTARDLSIAVCHRCCHGRRGTSWCRPSNVLNLITIVSTVVTLMATGFLVGRWLNMYPIEAAIVNALP